MKNPKEYNPFNNQIPIAEWCEGILDESILSDEADTLVQQIILINSMYESAFTSTPEGCKLVGSINLEFIVSERCFKELVEITGDINISLEPTTFSPYHWFRVGGNRPSEYLRITIHTEPLEVVFLHNLKS